MTDMTDNTTNLTDTTNLMQSEVLIDKSKMPISEEEFNRIKKKQQEAIDRITKRIENVETETVTENKQQQRQSVRILSQTVQQLANKYAETLCVERMFKDASLPTKGSKGSAGYDLYSYDNHKIEPHERLLIGIAIRVVLPEGTYGRIAPRSGVSMKKIDVCAGVIDEDYTGEVKVLLHNHNNEPYFIKKGDRVAQLILECCANVPVKEIKKIEDIRGETLRGSSGFGSTGQ